MPFYVRRTINYILTHSAGFVIMRIKVYLVGTYVSERMRVTNLLTTYFHPENGAFKVCSKRYLSNS